MAGSADRVLGALESSAGSVVAAVCPEDDPVVHFVACMEVEDEFPVVWLVHTSRLAALPEGSVRSKLLDVALETGCVAVHAFVPERGEVLFTVLA